MTPTLREQILVPLDALVPYARNARTHSQMPRADGVTNRYGIDREKGVTNRYTPGREGVAKRDTLGARGRDGMGHLTPRQPAADAHLVAGNPATGFCSPKMERRKPLGICPAAFFVPWRALFHGWAGRESRKALPVLHPVCKPVRSAHLVLQRGVRFITVSMEHPA